MHVHISIIVVIKIKKKKIPRYYEKKKKKLGGKEGRKEYEDENLTHLQSNRKTHNFIITYLCMALSS